MLRSKLAGLRVGVTAARAHAAFGLAVSISKEARFSTVRIAATFVRCSKTSGLKLDLKPVGAFQFTKSQTIKPDAAFS